VLDTKSHLPTNAKPIPSQNSNFDGIRLQPEYAAQSQKSEQSRKNTPKFWNFSGQTSKNRPLEVPLANPNY
jgi:hypothetical protein